MFGLDKLRQVMRNGRSQVAIAGDQAIVPLGQRGFVHAWLVVEAAQERIAGKFEQIAPTRQILSQKHEVKAAVRHAGGFALGAVAWSDVCFDSKDGFDSSGLGLRIELHGAVEVSM